MMNLIRVFIVLVPLFVVGCGKSSYVRYGAVGDETTPVVEQKLVDPVSANDVAFLLPLNENGRPQPFVSLESQPNIPGDGNFQRIVQASQAEGVFFQDLLLDPDNWALVSFRYSPCIFFAGTPAPCKEHIRFVYQPMDPSENGAFLDFAFHVTYEYKAVDKAESSEVMDAFVKLREEAGGLTDGLPLAVHPVFSDSSLSLEYFNKMQETIWKPFVLDRPAKAITFMGLGVAPDGGANLGEWRFMFGALDEAGQWNLADLPDGSGQQVEVLGLDDEGNLESNIGEEVRFNIINRDAVSETEVANILLPQISNEHNVNCASCHIADNQIIRDTRSRLNAENFQFDQFATALANTVGDQADFTANLVSNNFRSGFFSVANGVPQGGEDAPLPEEEVVTRIFGYMHSQPVISQRMAFDNGIAVNAINEVIGADSGSGGQNLVCESLTQKLGVLSCLIEGGFATSIDECVQQTCQ